MPGLPNRASASLPMQGGPRGSLTSRAAESEQRQIGCRVPGGERSALSLAKLGRWSRDIARQARDLTLVAAAQLDDVAVGIADENRNVPGLAHLHRPLRNRDPVCGERSDRLRDRGNAQRDMRITRIFPADVHQDVFGRLAGIGIENEVDLDALRVAHDGHVIAGCPARECEPEDPVKGEGAVEIAYPNTDVIDPLDIDGLAHPTPPSLETGNYVAVGSGAGAA